MRRLRIAACALAPLLCTAPFDAACTERNLLASPLVSVERVHAGLVDERFDTPVPILRAEILLEETREVGAILVQAAAGPGVAVEGSVDGVSFFPVAETGPFPADGARALRLASPVRVRTLALVSADPGRHARVLEVAAWCRPPRSPAELAAARARRARVTERARSGIAAAALVLLAVGCVRRGRAFDVALAILGVAGFAAWWNFGQLHHGRHVHLWEQTHYFLGAKYFPELGYDGLYECLTVADFEAQAVPAGRRVRDMRSNRLVDATSITADPARCRARFAPERWQAFRADAAYFRSAIGPPRWERLFRDHGYNATPLWTTLGRLWVGGRTASKRTVQGLALIDPALLFLAAGIAIRVFGWRAAALAAIWFGTNRLADFAWIGGGLERQDWLLATVASCAAAHRERWAGAGALLGVAALLRIFPGFLALGLAARAFGRAFARRSPLVEPEMVRFACGMLVAGAVLVPLSAVATGPGAWGAFVENSLANVRSAGPNVVGSMAVLNYDHDDRREKRIEPAAEDPGARWLAAKRELFRERLPVQRALLALFAAFFAYRLRARPAWVALCLGVAFVPMASFVACYYYSVLVPAAFAGAADGGRRLAPIGVLLSALALATQVAARVWDAPLQSDTRFAVSSLAVVVAAVLLVHVGAGRRA